MAVGEKLILRLWKRSSTMPVFGMTTVLQYISPPKIGVRECRRVIGEYVLTIYDMLDGTYHHDTVAISSYGLDTWGSTKVGDKELNKLVKPYGIPYGH